MGLYKNPENLAPKQARKPFNHLAYKDARKIIALANKKLSKYKIHQATGVSKGKIARCLTLAKIIRTKPRINQHWKCPHEIITYSIKRWKVSKVLYKANRALTYARLMNKVTNKVPMRCHNQGDTSELRVVSFFFFFNEFQVCNLISSGFSSGYFYLFIVFANGQKQQNLQRFSFFFFFWNN